MRSTPLRCWRLAICVVVCVLRSTSAVAAEPGEDASAEASAASPEEKRIANDTFLKGMEYFDAKKYVEALEHFRESYKHVPSPNSLLMAARSLRRLGRISEAYLEYQHVAMEAEAAAKTNERYAETALAARGEMDDVKGEVALVTVKIKGTVPSSAVLRVAGLTIDREAWATPIPAAPGKISVILEGPTIEKREDVLDLNAGAEGNVELDVTALPEKKLEAPKAVEPQKEPGPPAKDPQKEQFRTGAYIGGAVGLAGLATFGVLVLLDGSDALRFASLGLGAVGVVGGVVLYALSVPSTPEKSASARGALVVGPGSVSIVGSF